jgi:23S rRNA pseudouridine2605 synthase
MSPEERLQKVLAAAGIGSRRACEAIIKAGRVKVNGMVAVLGDRADTDKDEVAIDDMLLDLKVEKKYFLLNKPPGYITTVKDTRHRPIVMDLIAEKGRFFPVGRLDKDTRGLLLITNDGYFAQKLMHPSHGVEKTYLIEAEGRLGKQGLAKLRKGVNLDDGITAAARVKAISNKENRCILEMAIHEGRKRQVRRMCEAVNLKVIDLMRTRLGPLDLRGLEEGSYRSLTHEEIQKLMDMESGYEL